MFERLRQKGPAVHVIRSAAAEAKRLGDRRIGTEHLLLGLLHDDDAARLLAVDLETARAELAGLDLDALRSIGLDVEGLSFADPTPARRSPPIGPGAFNSAARSAVDALLATAWSRNSRRAARDLLAALLDLRPPDPAADLISRLGVDRSAVRSRLAS